MNDGHQAISRDERRREGRHDSCKDSPMKAYTQPDRRKSARLVSPSGWRRAKIFRHGVRVATARIIAFANPTFTISMSFPECDAGFVVGCRFQSDYPRTLTGEFFLDVRQKSAGDAVSPVIFEHVHRDDIPIALLRGGYAKSHNLAICLRHDTCRARMPQILPQVAACVCDLRYVTLPVNLVENLEIRGPVGSQVEYHG
jgi:hypothetical protein